MRQDRFLIGILAGIGALVLLSIALFFARRGTLAYGPEDNPAGVTRNFVVAVKKGDYERAYAYLADWENKPNQIDFRLNYQNYQASAIASTGIEVGAATVDGQAAAVQVTLLHSGGGLFSDIYRETQSAELVQQGGAWKIKNMPYPFFNPSWVEPVKPVPAP
jgi:hypothetical protein